MTEHKKYTSITRYGKAGTGLIFKQGEHISVTEKVDGANASWLKDNSENIGVSCFSRNNKLSAEKNKNLNGFYQWVQMNITPIKEKLNPKYRYFGEWNCLSGDTVIKKTSGGKMGNYMTLREMYKYSITPIKEVNKSTSKKYETRTQWEKEGYPSLYSLDMADDLVKPNKMAKIIYSGDKDVYEIETRKGYVIKSTLEHRFLTNRGWKQLKELQKHDVVAVTSLLSDKTMRRLGCGTRKIKEAQDKHKDDIGECERCGNKSCLQLHHKDEDYKNNNVDNWEVLCFDCHSKAHKLHGKKMKLKSNYNYEFDTIKSITFIGVEDCYDISMEGGENNANFVANGFIVHNCKHKVAYKPEYTNQFFLFSIWDEEIKEYLSDEIVRSEAEKLGLQTVEYFYEGEFISFEHLMSFVGKSNTTLVPDTGEGIVVKNVKYKDRNNAQVFVKLVSEKFAEIQPQRLPKNPNIGEEHDAVILSVLTKPRLEKMIYKLVDEGLLEENYNITNMGQILKNIHRNIMEDMLAEESEILQYIDGDILAKRVGKLTPSLIKEVLKEQGRM